jgi:hypothetical protein
MALTIQEANDAWYVTFEYTAGWYSYEDTSGIEHLIIDWVEVASAYNVFQYEHDVWEVIESFDSNDRYLFYKWEKVCKAYYFHRTEHDTVYQVLLDWEDRVGRLVDVLDRTTWF